MSNARIQFSLASEEVWNAYNPLLKEGEIVTVLKANKKVKLVQGKLGGATYSESTVIWDEDEAQAIMSRTEAAAVTATAQATAASDSASNAAASQSAAAMSATNAKASESAAKNSATSAASSASTASTQAGKAAENARLAEGYKTAAETAKSNASLYAANAKADSEKATASKEAAQSAATTASNFANASRSSANEARTYRDNAKNYSENVNVFIPSVSSAGVLSWTNKAGLTNPASVNIKGAKGDTGTAASITIGSVTTGAAGSNASVTNSGTASNAVLNFMLPRGKDGKDGGITVDAALSDTSINPVQNKVVKAAIDSVAASVPTKVSDLPNDAGYLTQHQSLADYAKTSVANTWTAAQTLNFLSVYYEKYPIYIVTGTNDTPIISAMMYKATNNFTLDLDALAMKVDKSQISVFSAYFTADADYALTITNCGTVKYIGSASDVAITSSGLLLNIMMVKDASNNLTSIVQANKLS